MTETPSLSEVSDLAAAVLTAVERAVVGKRAHLELVLAGVLAGGHVLMEDFPGLGKTLAARSFAQALGLDDNVHGRANHLADGARRKRESSHCDHGLDA